VSFTRLNLLCGPPVVVVVVVVWGGGRDRKPDNAGYSLIEDMCPFPTRGIYHQNFLECYFHIQEVLSVIFTVNHRSVSTCTYFHIRDSDCQL